MDPVLTLGLAAALVGGGVATALSPGCVAAPLSAAGAPVEVRVLVKLERDVADPARISDEATRRAGVPVAHAAAAGSAWHALALRCTSTAECEAAVGRLRTATDVYAAVDVEGRKRP